LKVKLETSVDKNRWDSLVASSPGGHIFQSATWAKYQREYLGIRDCFFTVEESDGGRALAFLYAYRESPFNRALFERPLSSLTVPLADRLSAGLNVKYGPIYIGSPGTKERQEMLGLLIETLEDYCRRQGIVSIKGDFGSIYETGEDNPGMEEFMRARGYRARPEATFLVDLSQDEDTLWKNLKQSARKAIRRGRDQGITVERMKEDTELASYHEFSCRCRRSLSLKSNSLRNFTEMWRFLRPAGMLEIFYALQEGELIGGLGVWQHAGVVVEWGSVQSERAKEEKLFCSDLLKWEIIRWGHSQGHRLYDLAGVEPDLDQVDPKNRGIYQFKAKWGGEFLRFNNYSKTFKPLRAKIFKTGLNLAKKLRS
jgi:Acetyltransferase (GNAT) domain